MTWRHDPQIRERQQCGEDLWGCHDWLVTVEDYPIYCKQMLYLSANCKDVINLSAKDAGWMDQITQDTRIFVSNITLISFLPELAAP